MDTDKSQTASDTSLDDIFEPLSNQPSSTTPGSLAGLLSLPFLGRYGYFQQTWADTIEDNGDIAEQFKATFWELLLERHGLEKVVFSSQEKILAGRWRQLEVARSGLATAIISVNDYGKDLYLSWRVFIKRPFAMWKIVAFVILNILPLILRLLAVAAYQSGRGSIILRYYDWLSLSSIAVIALAFVWTVVILGGVIGLFRSNDIFIFFRASIREFHWDDLYALAITVDKVMRETADKLDLKAKLTPAQSVSSIRQAQHL